MATLPRASTVSPRLALLGLAGALAACGGAGEEGGAPGSGGAAAPTEVVATVGDREITRASLDGYLAAAVGAAEELASVDAEVKSRLLDQLIDEERILGEAERRGLTLSDADRQGHLPPDAAGADAKGLDRVLLQRKFKQEVILKGVAVTPGEVEGYFNAHLAEFRQPAQAVFRKILMDDKRSAAQVHDDLAARPADFESIAAEKSLAPDGGRSQSYDEEVLPDSLRHAVETLEPGQLSPVIEDPQGFFILRLEGRQPASAPTLEQVRDEIELKLLTERSEKRYQEFLAELRQKMPVKLQEGKLPFSYVRKS